MVPAEKILQAAIAEQADIVGLSGLITPSLDEMCHVAAEMERQGFDVPLLIGGATTSRVHTAVKIHPNYRRGQAVYVNDASRAVGVVSALLSREARERTINDIRAEYARIAAAHARGEAEQASAFARRRPRQCVEAQLVRQLCAAGAAAFSVRDGSPIFRSPNSSTTSTGRRSSRPGNSTANFRRSSTTPTVGEAARSLFADAQEMLQRMAAERWFRASAVVGFWPANSEGDDILVFADEARREPIAVLHTLRQQLARREGRANVALADFVAPRASGLADYIGAFAVTAGLGEDAVAERFKHANDDYSAIMVKALADRLAEALAERMHQRVRKEFWAYAPDETLAHRRTDRRKISRHPPGARLSGAARPHREGDAVQAARRRARRSACELTESFAMWPGASVCGLYFSHPDSYYFGVGKIERDQVEDYAKRKGWTFAQAEKWLAPILNYDPVAARSAAE